jgi:hypothetical protein
MAIQLNSGFKLNFRLSARFSLNGMNNPQACFFMQMLLSIDLLMLTVQVLISTSCQRRLDAVAAQTVLLEGELIDCNSKMYLIN